MRSIWLASAAFIISTGIACAQTATPSPAPNGSTGGPIETSPGLSPGKETPPAAGQPPATINNNAGTTAPDNSAGAASGPGMATGSTGMPNGSMSNGAGMSSSSANGMNNGMSSTHAAPTMHHAYSHESMPANGTPASYLHIAKDAIRHHNKMRADDALSHAETLLLTRSVPQSDATPVDHSPAVDSIEGARKAVRDGDMTTASSDIDMAMGQMHHGMMKHEMHHEMSNGSMGNGAMSNGTIGNGAMGTSK